MNIYCHNKNQTVLNQSHFKIYTVIKHDGFFPVAECKFIPYNRKIVQS
jgi:hypothetical protein